MRGRTEKIGGNLTCQIMSYMLKFCNIHESKEYHPTETASRVRTRGLEVVFVKERSRICRLDIRKYSYSQRTINEQNKLSTDCVQ